MNCVWRIFTSLSVFILPLAIAVPNRLKVGVLLMTDSDEPFDLKRTASALDIAFEFAERNYRVQFDSVSKNYSTNCPKETSVGYLAELYYTHGVRAVIGPACSDSLMASAQLAQYLRLPMVSGVGDLVTRDPESNEMYLTFTRLSYNIAHLSNSMKAIMAEYKWRHVAILYDISYVFFDLAGSNLVSDLKQDNDLPRPYDIQFKGTIDLDKGALLSEASKHARVFIIFCHADKLREFLYEAHNLQMTEGDYAFITMELFPSDWLGYYMKFDRGDDMDAAVKIAYESVLILTLRQPDNPEYENFADEVKDKAFKDYGYSFGNESVNYFITAFYDSVIYLAAAINRTVEEGGALNTTDGIELAQKLWNDTFDGITGPVKIDEVGDRVADFDVLDMTDPDAKTFQRVGRFRGATLQYNPTSVAIHWPLGLPADMPPCGFTGELCIEQNDYLTEILTSVVACIVLLVVIVVFFIFRKLRMDSEIYKKTWLVPFIDVKITKNAAMGSTLLSKSHISIASDSKTSINDLDQRQIFAVVGICKGTSVCVRRLKLKSLDLNKKVLMEFRQLQTTLHTNLARFIGAYIEPDKMAIMMEYCPRGSLADIIENESIELDWTFRNSLISDIIRGMQYLHYSSIKVHGRLTSTNCVIDSRFLLKLTDYGIPTVYKQDRRAEESGAEFNLHKLLWTAPELLRDDRWFCGTQEGDVYSFGIMLQEIIVRGQPFCSYEMDSTEIVNSVKRRSSPPFRPQVKISECKPELHKLMECCWHESPEQRPDFHGILNSFKALNKGQHQTGNIMDNLLKRMEQYANNLEVLVGDRTKAYMDEKKKAEDLLHRLLPISVAKQLESGNYVEPETYECVTIYFSDIVGFTNISAGSSPMQVVALLNDLYTCFDTIIDNFDVYKVETIGDAYMVASGLPVRNGDAHATEIANMALNILECVIKFKIRHRPGEQLKIRIGLHSGSVVAGVVGLTMPRYCLFGDTVNTASRMESNSEALKIHISAPTRDLLHAQGGYKLEKRGEIEVKGKGTMTTYWLEDKL